MPLSLLWMYAREASPYLVILAVAGAFFWGWLAWTQNQREVEEARFQEYNSALVGDVEARMDHCALLSRAFAGLVITLDGEVDGGAWREYWAYRRVQEAYPWIKAVAYCPVVRLDGRDAFVARMREAGGTEYTLFPEGDRNEYAPVTLAEPAEVQAGLLGCDLRFQEERRRCMDAARESGETRISALMTLEMPPHTRGAVMVTPVYASGLPTNTPEERAAAAMGHVVAVMSLDGLAVRGDVGEAGMVGYEVYDNGVETPSNLIYESRGDVRRPSAMFSESRTVEVYGRPWAFFFATALRFEDRVDRVTPMAILVCGVFVTVLTVLLFMQEQKVREKAEGIALDMTEALRRSEREYRTLTESLPMAVARLGPHMEVLTTNATLREWFPGAKDAARALCHQVMRIPPCDEPCAECQVPRVLEEGSAQAWETVIETAQGKRLARISAIPNFTRRGRVSSVVVLIEDVSDRRQVEDSRIAQAAAEERARTKSRFLANMSHEIRTPLNAIIGFTYILQRDAELSARQADILQTLQRSGEHLLALVNDILDLSKIDSGYVMPEEAPFSLKHLVKDVGAAFLPRASAKGLWLAVNSGNGVPDHVEGDENRLRQILMNLVGNAVKFTQTGGVTIRVGGLSGERGKPDKDGRTRLVFEVEDTGPGLSKADQTRLFHEFEQGEAGRVHGGTGLGLAISHRLVQILGGELTVAGGEGAGTCFRFELPLRPVSADECPPPRRKGRVLRLADGGAPPRILTVDDNEENLLFLRGLLGAAGFAVVEARDGAEAVVLFGQERPDAVLMDMRMPVMDGYEAIRRIREREDGETVPVIGITASAFEDQRGRVMGAGASGFLTKPFQPEQLFDLLGRFLGVEYLYSEEGEGETAPDTPSAQKEQTFSDVPEDMIWGVRRAMESGNMKELSAAVGEVEAFSPELGRQLRELASNFDFGRILELIGTGELEEDALS
jgi:signal transduction histidine kinase/CheY-like chemotaxis protein/CHASE1-domain containing sensor protein